MGWRGGEGEEGRRKKGMTGGEGIREEQGRGRKGNRKGREGRPSGFALPGKIS